MREDLVNAKRVIACCAMGTRSGHILPVHPRTIDVLAAAVEMGLEVVLIGPDIDDPTMAEERSWEEMVATFFSASGRSLPSLRAAFLRHPVEKREVLRRSQGLAKGRKFPLGSDYSPNGKNFVSRFFARRTLGLDLVDLFDPEFPLQIEASRYSQAQLESPLACCFDIEKGIVRVNKLTQEDAGNNDLDWLKLRARMVSNLLGGRKCKEEDYEKLRAQGIVLAF